MLKSIIVQIVRFCTRLAWPVIVLAVLLTAASFYYSVRHFGINTDTNQLISTAAPWRQREIEFDRAFPHRAQTILVVVQAPTPELTKRAADAYLVRRQSDAQAVLAEKSAVAEGIRRERAALNGSAGDAYVSLQLIDALQKKEIRQIPKLPNGNVIIDGNKLLQQLGVLRTIQQQQAEPPQQ